MKVQVKNRVANVMGQAAYAQLVAAGAGIGGRNRTMQSKRDKARDPRRQRQAFRCERWG